jgi:hypothetical protein
MLHSCMFATNLYIDPLPNAVLVADVHAGHSFDSILERLI